MRVARVVSFVSLGLLAGLSAAIAAVNPHDASGRPGVRSTSFVHDRVRDRVREEGEARVIAVMGDPALPQIWARDWRQRGGAIRELARRVKSDAPRFRVHREFEIFPFLAGTVDRQGMEELAASPYVEAVYPDREHRAALSQSGPLIGQPYAEGTAGYDGTGIGIVVNGEAFLMLMNALPSAGTTLLAGDDCRLERARDGRWWPGLHEPASSRGQTVARRR